MRHPLPIGGFPHRISPGRRNAGSASPSFALVLPLDRLASDSIFPGVKLQPQKQWAFVGHSENHALSLAARRIPAVQALPWLGRRTALLNETVPVFADFRFTSELSLCQG